MQFASAPADESTLYWYAVDVERCVDGDTFSGSLLFGFGLSRARQYFRLAYVNTPERGQPGFDEATEFLRDLIGGRTVMVNTHRDKSGRYKRVICETFVDGVNVNKALLESGHAVLVDY